MLSGLAVWALPRLLRADPRAQAAVVRVEAVASWTEMLRDTLAAAAGLEQAISAYQWPERVDQVYEALGSTGAGAHAYLASVLSNTGREKESRAHSDRSLDLAERVDRPVTRAQVWFMRAIFHTTALTLGQWLVCIGVAATLIVVDEVIKYFLRRSRRKVEGRSSAASPTSEGSHTQSHGAGFTDQAPAA